MSSEIKFPSIKDKIIFFSGQNNSNKSKVGDKNSGHTDSNKQNSDNKKSVKNDSNKAKVDDKKIVNNNSNQAKHDNKSIKNTVSNNVKIDDKNIQKNENNKIIGNYLLKEKENIKIYKYPESGFDARIAVKSKKILFLGNAQESFINTFINIYRSIEFKEEFRHKIDFNKNIKNNYDISFYDNSEHIRIASIPFDEEIKENYIKNTILEISKMKINLVFYTFNKNISDINPEQEKEIEFYKYLLSFLDIRDKIIFLCDSNEELNDEEKNKFLNKFNIDKNDVMYKEGKSYSNEIICINTEIIYDTNNNANIQNEWEIVTDKMKDIRDIIKKSEEIIELKKEDFFKIMLNDNESKIEEYFNKINRPENKDRQYFLYFLGEIKFEKDRINILITLINIMIKAKHKLINIKNNDIEFIDNKNYRNIIRTLSKIPFSNIKNLTFRKCELYDVNSIFLNSLITSNLENLDLSFNHLDKINLIFPEKIENLKNIDLSHNNINVLSSFIDVKFINLINLNLSYNNITDIKILAENDKFINLKKLCLDHNNISNVSCLLNSKFPNLIELDLSFNNIENIDFLELNTNLNNLEKIDLSNNKIKQLSKIDLKTIKYLYLSNNHITEGINEFIQCINNLSHKLIIEKLTDNSFKFDYDENVIINFDCFLKDNTDTNKFLEKISFNGVNFLKIKGFNDTNIKFFSNDTLKDLKELDIKENSLTKISIFDNIAFPNIKRIIVNKEDFNDNSLENLIKNFPSIKVKLININPQRINIKYNNPELEINNKNFDILYYHIGEVDEIKIESFPNDLKVFSYDTLRDKKLPIFNNIKVENLEINYEKEKGKYSCEMTFKLKSTNLKVKYDFDNLNFMKSDEILSEITSINFSNVIIDQNINFENDIAYNNIKNLYLDYCIIENDSIFEQINNKIKKNNLNVSSNGTKSKFTKNIYKDIFKIGEEKLTKDDNILNYIAPFKFTAEINNEIRYDFIKNSNLKNIKILAFSDANINNLDFLKNDTLINLDKLYLNNNNIEDISIFDDYKIHFHNLRSLDLRDNPIKKGLEVLKKNFFLKCSPLKLDLSLNELKVLIKCSIEYPFEYCLNIYVKDFNELPNYFEKDKVLPFENSSTEVVDKIKEIFGLPTDAFKKKKEVNDNRSGGLFDDYEEEKPHIIIDTGTCYTKAGLSGEEGPRAVFPSMVGYPKYASGMVGGDKKEFYVGTDAEAKRGVLKLNYPIEGGEVNNWDDVEKIWGNVFTNELRVAPEEHNIMIIEPPNNDKFNREKIAQIMFETFNVPGLYIANSAVLSLYAVGKFYGITIDSGEDMTHFVPIYDGFIISHAYIGENYAGRDLTLFLMKLLNESGYRFSTSFEKEIVKSIKEKACYVASDLSEELKWVEPYDYELPDGTHIIIKDQRIRCPEALFKPELIGKDGVGIAKACNYSIQKCDIDIKKDLYNCIVLSGGNSMFNGLEERLKKEIKYIAPYSMQEEVRVIASPERKYATWYGGSILSTISTFESSWITKTEYEENGATIVHRKCF